MELLASLFPLVIIVIVFGIVFTQQVHLLKVSRGEVESFVLETRSFANVRYTRLSLDAARQLADLIREDHSS